MLQSVRLSEITYSQMYKKHINRFSHSYIITSKFNARLKINVTVVLKPRDFGTPNQQFNFAKYAFNCSRRNFVS